MAESEELKNLLLRVKEMSEKSGLELNIFIKEMMIILSYISVKIALKIIENHIEKLFYKLFWTTQILSQAKITPRLLHTVFIRFHSIKL